MSVLEVNLSFFDIYHSFADTLLVSFQHAFFLALPFSPPVLISLRRLLIEDFRSGIASYLGTALGYTSFLSLLLFGFRQLIQFWYDLEPTFFLFGIILTIKLLISFYNESVYKDRAATVFEDHQMRQTAPVGKKIRNPIQKTQYPTSPAFVHDYFGRRSKSI